MRSVTRFSVLVILTVAVLGAASCASNGLDDSKAANVLLQVDQIPAVPPIATSGSGAACIFIQPPQVSIILRNQAKNSLAQSPFGDIVLTQVVVDYVWNGAPATPSTLIDPAGLTVPVDKTATFGITPVAVGDLTPVGTYEGRSGVATLTIYGKTVDGYDVDPVQASLGISLQQCQQTAP